MYDASRASLYQPGGASSFFDFDQDQINNESVLCAEMARLAYVKNTSTLVHQLSKVMFDLVVADGYRQNGTQVFIAQKKTSTTNTMIVSFRGTEADDPTDLFTDANFLKTEWRNKDNVVVGKVHTGFANALMTPSELDSKKPLLVWISDQIERYLTGDTKILITGHSLGAALATLMTGFVANGANQERIALYTFGSPAVGDAEFQKTFENIRHTRYVNCCDLVTQVPPELIGYRHSGRVKYINQAGEIFDSPSERYIEDDRFGAFSNYLKDYAFMKGTVAVRSLADHSPVNYVSAICKNL